MILPIKKIATYDLDKNENGFLMELKKEGKYTTSYLTCCYPGAFKGYHLHKVRTANYVCVKGTITIILYTSKGREEYVMTAGKPEKLHIPVNVPTGLWNSGTEEAWIVNFPDPAYDPDLKDEQVDYTQEEVDSLYGIGNKPV